ncbi:MAG: ParB/RepB/Spo0J family partition protein [Dehalococcoidia bacterium]|nr:ParB/RepB/Spo0J family partition protein [Dehalococcoidia bacterium]
MTATTKKATGKTTTAMLSGLGLEDMGDLSALLDTPVTVAKGGGPLKLDINLIDEDPKQPRTANNPGFTDESLNELSASIKLRGVKTPISVRDNPTVPGRFIINHGARRFRASKRAGQDVIPGFIDNDYNEADQVVENLQRNELTAREIADFIGREMAKGVKKVDIAKAISKSPAFVTQHITLLDLPDPISEAFNGGRVKDVTVVNELVTAYKKTPQAVSDWLDDDSQDITRGSVKLLREFLYDKSRHETSDEEAAIDPDTVDVFTESPGVQGSEGEEVDKEKEKAKDPDKLKKVIVQVQHDGRPARLILNRRPPEEGFAWLKYDDDGHEFVANLAHVQLVAVLEA